MLDEPDPDAQGLRNLVGIVMAYQRGDEEGYETLRPDGASSDFIRHAFGTILLLADVLVQATGHDDPTEVLEHLQREEPESMVRTIARMAQASLRGDKEEFDSLGRVASKDALFTGTIFNVIIWFAEQIARATGSTAEAVLRDLALRAAGGEAGD